MTGNVIVGALCAAVLAVGATSCSSSTSGSPMDEGMPSPSDTKEPPSGSGDSDAGALREAGSDGGGPVIPGPKPPTGYTRCGQGTITASSANATCGAPSRTLSRAPVSPRACDDATLSGGEWEVWCGGSTDAPYFYVRFDDIARTSSGTKCPTSATPRVHRFLFDLESDDDSMRAPAYVDALATPTFTLSAGKPVTALVETYWQHSMAFTEPPPQSGTGNVFLLVVGCSELDMVMAGAAISWESK